MEKRGKGLKKAGEQVKKVLEETAKQNPIPCTCGGYFMLVDADIKGAGNIGEIEETGKISGGLKIKLAYECSECGKKVPK